MCATLTAATRTTPGENRVGRDGISRRPSDSLPKTARRGHERQHEASDERTKHHPAPGT